MAVKILPSSSVFLALLLGAVACGPAGQDGQDEDVGSAPHEIKKALPLVTFGAVIDQTGAAAEPTNTLAVKLAEKDIKNAIRLLPGRDRVDFRILYADSANNPAVALPAATDMVVNGKATVLVTDLPAHATAMVRTMHDADPANNLPVPVICVQCVPANLMNPTSVNADPIAQSVLRNEQGWMFRGTANSKAYASVGLQYLNSLGVQGDTNGDGVFKIVVWAFQGNAQTIAAEISAYATLAGLPAPVIETVIHPTTADPATFNFQGDFVKVFNGTNDTTGVADGVPDAVVIQSFQKMSSAFINQFVVSPYASTGATPYAGKLLNFQAYGIPSSLAEMGANANGQEGLVSTFLDDPLSGAIFRAEWRAFTHTEPLFRHSHYYDSTVVMALAYAQAIRTYNVAPGEVTGAMVRDSVRLIQNKNGTRIRTGPLEIARGIWTVLHGGAIDYVGASGPMDFDPHGNVQNKLIRVVVQDGVPVPQEKYDCVADPVHCPEIP